MTFCFKRLTLPKRLSKRQYGVKEKRWLSMDIALLRELWFNVLPKNLELKTADGSLDQNFRSTYTVVVSSNRQYICTTHGDHSVRISETERWTCKRAFVAHHRTPICARFHPSYTHIVASGCLAGEVYVFDIDNAAFEQMPIRSVGAITSLTFHPVADLLFASTAHGLFLIDWRKSTCLHSIDFETKFLLWMQFDAAGSSLYAAFENISGERKLLRTKLGESAERSGPPSARRRPLIRLARSVNRHSLTNRAVGATSDDSASSRSVRTENEHRVADRQRSHHRSHHIDDDSELVVHQLFRQAEAILHRLAATASRLGQGNNSADVQSTSSGAANQNNESYDPPTPRSTLASLATSDARMLNAFLEGRPPLPPAVAAAAAVASGNENYTARMSQLELQIRETRSRLEQLRDSLHRIQEGLVPPLGNAVHNPVANIVEPPLARLRNRLLVPPAGPGVRALLDDLHGHYQQGPCCPAFFGEAPTELFRWNLNQPGSALTSLTDKDIVLEKISECVVRGESAISLSLDGTKIACFVPSNSFVCATENVQSSSSSSPLSTPSRTTETGASSSGRSPVVVVPGSPSLIRTMVAVFDITSSGRYTKSAGKTGEKAEDQPSTSSASLLTENESQTYWLPIASTTFEGAGTSLSFSPDGSFIVVGFSLRSANISSLTSPVLRIFEISPSSSTLRTLCHVRHPTSEPFWELPRLAVNCLVWIDHSRGGIIYGTNQGHVVRCCPMTRSAFNERTKGRSSSSNSTALSAEHTQALASLRMPAAYVPIVPLDLQNLNNISARRNGSNNNNSNNGNGGNLL